MPDNGDGGRESFRIATWAVTGALVVIGLFFSLYSGVPWTSRESGERLRRDIERLERLDEMSMADRRRLEIELRRIAQEGEWARAELERLKAYVYPQPSGRRGGATYTP